MAQVTGSRFPDGKQKAVTLSYDDGTIHDRQMVDILDLYGVRGTFHLNSGKLGTEGYLEADEIAELFVNHEVASHTVTHPLLDHLPSSRVIHEVLEDRRRLESLVEYPVRGMSYPYGSFNDIIVKLLPSLSIQYSRTTVQTVSFNMPDDFLRWRPTCHHNQHLLDTTEQFLQLEPQLGQLVLFYVWGHSGEFDRDNSWDLIEEFCQEICHQDTVWYATSIEIVDYMTAIARLEFSVDNHIIRNPSSIPVWVDVDGQARKLEPGSITLLKS